MTQRAFEKIAASYRAAIAIACGESEALCPAGRSASVEPAHKGLC
jgi:hypothetical protein